MPVVPIAPGVPPLRRGTGEVPPIISLLAADVLGFFQDLFRPRWGLYQDGEPVIFADSVRAFSYRQENPISDYQVEEGSFESYNKIKRPYQIRFRFMTGGSDSDRQAFLSSIADAIDGTALYDAVTPEVVYTRVNVVHQNYDRSANAGLGLLMVDVGAEQVRVGATTAFSNTQAPSAAGQVNGGTVQSQPPTPAQQTAFQRRFFF